MDISKYADKLIKQFGLNTCIYEPEQEFYIFYDFNKAYLQFRDIYQAQGIEIGYKGGLLQFAQDLIYFSENLRYKYSTDKLVDLHGQYLKMKQQFPTVGVIIVNDKLDRYLLVQLINNVQWLFPKGFKDPKESDIQCAVRQVKEQTGLNVENYLKQELPSFTSDLKPQIILYVAVGVNDTEVLQPTVRNKISMIKWIVLYLDQVIAESRSRSSYSTRIIDSNEVSIRIEWYNIFL
ncbi:MAG: hypothetical protein EZS28_018029 [Streblomastix strix]|uniref:Nudix hydrolase domain-containing protein n=1 Tax=Streblomastix strix TaxID=222440 RepID=A0A5J4VUQ0_9EUKA|nr:MAG: hypothetical protein EZS28_018029 [Streblomastix strix]